VTRSTLVLDQGYQPHRVVSWQRAVHMLFDGKVEVVSTYDDDIRSVSITIKMPAVVRLLSRVRGKRHAVKFSRINVATRDEMRCQYCSVRLPLSKLTYDHVVPRAQGGRTVWENIVMACYPCNESKANRTPAQAGMTLRKAPVKPAYLPVVSLRFSLQDVPSAWASWLYWNGALEEGS
jgi:5-methylcytosine-specific restriction endonuclease McrA